VRENKLELSEIKVEIGNEEVMDSRDLLPGKAVDTEHGLLLIYLGKETIELEMNKLVVKKYSLVRLLMPSMG